MVNIKYIELTLLLFFFSCANAQNNSNSNEYIYGKWKYVKHLNWRASRYGNKEIESIKHDTLIINEKRIYLKKSKFIETCSYSNIKFSYFFDREDKEPNVIEDRALAIKYTKEQLSLFRKIETNCGQDICLSVLYLKQDTLILNYCGGITVFLIKIPR